MGRDCLELCHEKKDEQCIDKSFPSGGKRTGAGAQEVWGTCTKVSEIYRKMKAFLFLQVAHPSSRPHGRCYN